MIFLQTRVKVIVNPVSAHGRTKEDWPDIEKAFKEEGLSFTWQFTEHEGHCVKLVREALKNGYETILAVGGDGTINEALNGFFDNGIKINEKAKLAVLSRGSGSDLVRSLQLSKNPRIIAKKILEGKVKEIDCGYVIYKKSTGVLESRCFINVSDTGIGGETCQRVNRAGKYLGGFLSFLWGALVTILKYDNKHFTVTLDNQEVYKGEANSVVIANGRFFGGGMEIAPLAQLDDSLFDVVILGPLNKFELIINFYRVYKGTHLAHPKVFHFRGQRVKISSYPDAVLEIDGETPGLTNATLQIISRGIKIVV